MIKRKDLPKGCKLVKHFRDISLKVDKHSFLSGFQNKWYDFDGDTNFTNTELTEDIAKHLRLIKDFLDTGYDHFVEECNLVENIEVVSKFEWFQKISFNVRKVFWRKKQANLKPLDVMIYYDTLEYPKYKHKRLRKPRRHYV